LLGFPLHQRCAVTQWQVDRGAQMFSLPFSWAALASWRSEVLRSSPAQTGRVRQLEHGSSINCGLKGLRSQVQSPNATFAGQSSKSQSESWCRPKVSRALRRYTGGCMISPELSRCSLRSAQCHASQGSACCKPVSQASSKVHSARLTWRCSGRGPINCSARGRPVSERTRHASALLPVGEPPLNLDVRRLTMRYADFIQELQELVTTGEALLVPGTSDETPSFRAWRHRTESLVKEAQASGRRLPGDFRSSSRMYMPMYSPASADEKYRAFSRDVSDTLIELRLLIDQHEKYGEPQFVQLVGVEASSPELPSTVTFAWLWKHVPVSFWVKVATILMAAFLIGVAVGRTNAYQDLETIIKEVVPGGSAGGA